MSWFFPAVICLAGWGLADFFYKKSSDADDRYSHLRLTVWVGLVMGLTALVLFPRMESGMRLADIPAGMLRYAPASLCYVLSMVIGYAGLRYLELSVASPVQNASGGLSAVCMLLYFLAAGKITSAAEAVSPIELAGAVPAVAGVVALAVIEQRLSRDEALKAERKYRRGALAMLFPLAYCLFDTLGTAADGVILDGTAGAGFGEIDVLVLYGLTFFLCGLAAMIMLRVKEKKWYNPFARRERTKAAAALAEEFGQIFYVYAMAENPVLAAPVVASYCIVSVLLSRVLLKEKLTRGQYAAVCVVLAGIVLLGFAGE